MSKKQDGAINDPFSRLTKAQQTLVRLDFEGGHSNKEIAPKIGLKNETTVSHWRKRPWYEPAFNAYASKAIKGKYKSLALRTLIDLLNAKSEMVKLQAATSVLKLSGMLSDSDTPELIQAKVRKANAEADIAEQQAKAYKNNNNLTKIIFTDDLKPDDDQKGDENDGTDAKSK
ncbi:helix-turn-helix domain-containing protein [Limosilactobacillus oris]|uniref:helix-turn-helix domain-containing protein n=1 Tax=Limosilactobacillus oris TaxID=1632 RepID=UPI0018843F2A|nr:helix-turn-helix domain-containing protein [Limosilactobacillus oris]MBF0600851.1 helix-turn-helix domain-containing protein [Limosilactobacillus oris]